MPCSTESNIISDYLPIIPPAYIYDVGSSGYIGVTEFPDPNVGFWALMVAETTLTITCECVDVYAEEEFITEPMVASGYTHTMILKADGTVWSFGDNEFGALGTGDTINRALPNKVHGVDGIDFLQNIVQIDCGNKFSAALKTDGTIYTWGSNERGQLGDNSVSNITTPVQVHNTDDSDFIADVIDISTGPANLLCAKSDNSAFACGTNEKGQLGRGFENDLPCTLPRRILGDDSEDYISDVIKIESALNFSAALKSDGSVYTWGGNYCGVLGVYAPILESYFPLQVTDVDSSGYLANIVDISSMYMNTLALSSDGIIYSWGCNWYGQIGDGYEAIWYMAERYDRYIPVHVLDSDSIGFLTDVIAISSGEEHSLALKSDGTVWAWGNNDNGQLGIDYGWFRTLPSQVYNEDRTGFLEDVIAITAGGQASFAITSDGYVWAWGKNLDGQLGINTFDESRHLYPTRVLNPDGSDFFNVYE
jgi:alpha-tubulin suppressor-like RCC1 family protein